MGLEAIFDLLLTLALAFAFAFGAGLAMAIGFARDLGLAFATGFFATGLGADFDGDFVTDLLADLGADLGAAFDAGLLTALAFTPLLAATLLTTLDFFTGAFTVCLLAALAWAFSMLGFTSKSCRGLPLFC